MEKRKRKFNFCSNSHKTFKHFYELAYQITYAFLRSKISKSDKYPRPRRPIKSSAALTATRRPASLFVKPVQIHQNVYNQHHAAKCILPLKSNYQIKSLTYQLIMRRLVKSTTCKGIPLTSMLRINTFQ